MADLKARLDYFPDINGDLGFVLRRYKKIRIAFQFSIREGEEQEG